MDGVHEIRSIPTIEAAEVDGPRTAFEPGVRNLTLLFSFSLVTITGLLVGVMSIVSGDNAVADARSTGEDAVQKCLTGSMDNVEYVMGVYLRDVTGEVESKLQTILDVPTSLITEMHNILKVRDPDTTTSPEWISHSFRHVLAAAHRSMWPTKLQLRFAALPFSENSIPGAWGGSLSFAFALDSNLFDVADGVMRQLVFETRDATGTTFQAFQGSQGVLYFGNADAFGYIDTKNGTRSECSGRNFTNMTSGEVIGTCSTSSAVFGSATDEVLKRALTNMRYDDSSVLNAADQIHHAPLLGVVNGVAIDMYLSWTHPAMPNLFARQGHRCGLVGVTLSTEGLQEVIVTQELPAASTLYVVQHDPWTDEVGNLVACNLGDPRNVTTQVVQGYVLETTKPLNVVHFPDARVSDHGKFVIFAGGGYATAAARSKQEFLRWIHEGQECWYTVSTLERSVGLRWYITFVVHRRVIMKDIDASVMSIQNRTDDASRRLDSKRDRNLIVLIIAIVAVGLVLLAFSFIFTNLIIGPLLVLEQEMANVASMKLEDVDVKRPISRLSEVGCMEHSFRKMVANLLRYRDFIPQATFAQSEGESDTPTEEDTPSPAQLSPRIGRGASIHKRSRRNSLLRQEEQRMATEGLKLKFVSLIVFNVLRWHQITDDCSLEAIHKMHTDVLALLLQTVQGSKGVPDVFLGDRLIASFNAVIPSAIHKLSAVTSGVNVRDELRKNPIERVQMSFAAVTGEARVGSIGCTGMKRFTIFTTATPWAFTLERLNKILDTNGLLDSWIVRDTEQNYAVRCVGRTLFKKRSPTPIQVYEVVSRIETSEQEWMYQLQEGAESNPYLAWNKAWSFVFDGKWEEATAVLAVFSGERTQLFAMLQGVIERKRYDDITELSLASL
ncbi:hypothetical protein DIPPA_17192 [Diplonema papillatum]|nr:hypothetical protein DIPPA_17192 [Diplonema papillatum]